MAKRARRLPPDLDIEQWLRLKADSFAENKRMSRRLIEAADAIAAAGARTLLPAQCPPSLVWRAEGGLVWTGHGTMAVGEAAEAVATAHNGVLSGLFGAKAMPEI